MKQTDEKNQKKRKKFFSKLKTNRFSFCLVRGVKL